MTNERLKITYICGPTAQIEFGGLRFLTDPTFDKAPGETDLHLRGKRPS